MANYPMIAVAGSVIAGNGAYGQLYEPFPATFELASLLPQNGGNGSLGFVLEGIDRNDTSGRTAAFAGDINGDGIDDLIVGADLADPNGLSNAGEAYVIFGRRDGFPPVVALSNLDGLGFMIVGVSTNDRTGVPVGTAGDINGDGIDDLRVGAPYADPDGRTNAGVTYIVFGSAAGFPDEFHLGALDGSNGFRAAGFDDFDESGPSSDLVGDMNGDGISDIVIGAEEVDIGGPDVGAGYVVFGRNTGFPPLVELGELDGTNGFGIFGIEWNGLFGDRVASAGDVNGDGLDDAIFGAERDGPTGRAYVVLGSDRPFPPLFSVEELNGSNGFRLDGVTEGDNAGFSSSSAGDFNGDGIDDILIGARSATVASVPDVGAAYVVFGTSQPFPAVIPLDGLDGTSGLRIEGSASGGTRFGFKASPLGDINGDGVDDVIIGAHLASPGGMTNAGEAFVIYGNTGDWPASIAAEQIADGARGFRLTGVDALDWSGRWVRSAGDLNGDGVPDIVVNAMNADPGGVSNAGRTYVVFGRHTACAGDLTGSADPGDGSYGVPDGDVDADDFFFYLDAFATGNVSVCDIDGDGDCDAEDFFGYLDLFAAGCE